MLQCSIKAIAKKTSHTGVIIMLKGKYVVLGVTGSIAAYKTASLASALKKLHCEGR